MKNIKLYISIMLLCACKDNFLDIKPDTFISASDYFRNESEATLAVNAAYSPLQSLAANSWWILAEMRADNTTYQYNTNDRRNLPMEQVDEFLMQVNNPQTDEFWRISYTGIARCNTILDRIDAIPFKSDTTRQTLTGQTLFLRALYYFNLVRMFGGVPLILQEVTSPDNTAQYAVKQSSADEVYTQVIADITAAAGKLPASYSGNDKGRATKGAAYTLLGEVYMTSKDFPAAITALQKVTTLGYSLLPDYAAIFHPANKNNAESIFEVQYLEGNQGESSGFIYRFAPFNSGSDIVGDNQLTGYNAGFNIPTHDIQRAYEAGDRRKTASIGYYVKAGNNIYDVASGDSIPYILKYDHPHTLPGATNDNWPVYRYAQVLLMLAEALNEDGQTAAAYPYIRDVRQRAGLPPLPENLGREAFRDAVYHESQVELAFENHRWYDLLRTGKAVEVMTAHGQRQKEGVPRLAQAYNIQPFQLLYPIPARERKLNPLLEQNPGW